MAGCTEVAGAVEVLHDCFGMPVEVSEDLLVRDVAVNGLIVLIEENGRLCQHVTAGAAGIDLLDGVADGAGDAIFVELTIDRGTLGKGS